MSANPSVSVNGRDRPRSNRGLDQPERRRQVHRGGELDGSGGSALVASPRPYALIAGQGRSGTNWLLDILNQSPKTHCRNEPNECAGSALSELTSGAVPSPELEAELESKWDEAIVRTSQSFGKYDHPTKVHKDHFSGPLQRMGLARVARSKRLQGVLDRVMPSLVQEEWSIPSWLVGKWQKDRSLPILKVNMSPGWVVWALRNRPEARILHIVRHPGGFLSAYIKRFLDGDADFYGDKFNPRGFVGSHVKRWVDRASGSFVGNVDREGSSAHRQRRRFNVDLESVERDNRNRLSRIAAHDLFWADRFGDLSEMSLVESELWYWRYCKRKTIHRAGTGNPHYQLVNYEELVRNPLEVSRSIYQNCGLDWDDTIEHAIRQLSSQSKSLASAWRDKLSAEQIEIIERVLGGSVMKDWWN